MFFLVWNLGYLFLIYGAKGGSANADGCWNGVIFLTWVDFILIILLDVFLLIFTFGRFFARDKVKEKLSEIEKIKNKEMGDGFIKERYTAEKIDEIKKQRVDNKKMEGFNVPRSRRVLSVMIDLVAVVAFVYYGHFVLVTVKCLSMFLSFFGIAFIATIKETIIEINNTVDKILELVEKEES